MSRLKWLLLIALCTVGVLPSEAQSSVTVTNSWQSHDWAIDGDQCSDGVCRSFRGDQYNRLYAFGLGDIFTVYEPNGFASAQYELPLGSIHGDILFDFEPLGNGYIALFGMVGGGHGLFLYNQETETVTQVELPIQVIACNPNSYPIGRSFMRLGTSSNIVACSTGENGYGFHIVDLLNQTIIHSIYSYGGGSLLRDRLGVMIAGQDGDIYLDTRRINSPILDALVPDANSIPETDFVMRYSITDETWSVIQIPFNQLYRSTFLGGSNAELMGVDPSGSLYFFKSGFNDNGDDLVDIVKLDPQGTQLWRVTETDLGFVPSNVSLLDEDEIFTFNYDANVGTIATYSVSVTDATPTP